MRAIFENAGFKYLKNIIIGVGAAVIMLGALGKITHQNVLGINPDTMLFYGLWIEAIIFLIQGLVPPKKDYYWEKLYPKLDKYGGGVDGAVAKIGGKSQTAELDKMLSNSKINQTTIDGFGKSLNNFGSSIDRLSNVTETVSATNEYNAKAKEAAQALTQVKDAYSKAAAVAGTLSISAAETKGYQDQVVQVTKNLSALNAVYELELSDTNSHLKNMNKYYSNLSVAMKNLDDSLEDTQKYKEQMAGLTKNLSRLNTVYGNIMSIPKEPRQQMISIMYLVLTALLALNVSAEIIEAFKRFNNSMEASNITVENKISGTYKAFEDKVEKNKGRGQEHLDKARNASSLSENVVAQLQKIKTDFQSFTDEGVSPEALAKANGGLVNASSQDATTKFFVKGTSDGRAPVSPKVKELMGDTRQQFLDYFADTPDELQAVTALIPDFTTEDGEKDFFYQLPAVAAMTEITRYESLVKSAESVVVEKLANRVGVDNVVFDQFEPAIIPNAEKFIDGDPLTLDLFLSASSKSSSKPQIFVNGKSQKVGPNGRANFEMNTSGSGDKSLNIEIKAANQFGEMKSYKKKFEYKVVPPFRQEYKGIVSPTAMNVFYIGVDNPVECGISGIDGSLIKASINGLGGTMQSQGNGKFTVRVSMTELVVIIVKQWNLEPNLYLIQYLN